MHMAWKGRMVQQIKSTALMFAPAGTEVTANYTIGPVHGIILMY